MIQHFSHFDTIPACVRRTDKQRDTSYGIYRSRIASRGKNRCTCMEMHPLYCSGISIAVIFLQPLNAPQFWDLQLRRGWGKGRRPPNGWLTPHVRNPEKQPDLQEFCVPVGMSVPRSSVTRVCIDRTHPAFSTRVQTSTTPALLPVVFLLDK